MKRKLLLKARADFDVADHYRYLLLHNPRAAGRFRSAVLAAYKRIAVDCRSCATLPMKRFEGLEIRFAKPRGFRNYLIYFQVTDDAVFILRVLHSSQDAESELRP